MLDAILRYIRLFFASLLSSWSRARGSEVPDRWLGFVGLSKTKKRKSKDACKILRVKHHRAPHVSSISRGPQISLEKILRQQRACESKHGAATP